MTTPNGGDFFGCMLIVKLIDLIFECRAIAASVDQNMLNVKFTLLGSSLAFGTILLIGLIKSKQSEQNSDVINQKPDGSDEAVLFREVRR